MKVEPIVLSGDLVSLEPLRTSHIGKLSEFCFDENIWKWYPFRLIDIESLTGYVTEGLNQEKRCSQLPFVTVDQRSQEIVGSTKFMNIDTPNRRVEIGSTWINPRWQRTYINTSAKLLMLTHAFEVWKCIRVEFKTDALNIQSRRAILRLGAVEEGTHRQHMITVSGRYRDSVFYSILDSEWDAIKAELEKKLKSNQGFGV